MQTKTLKKVIFHAKARVLLEISFQFVFQQKSDRWCTCLDKKLNATTQFHLNIFKCYWAIEVI